MLFIVSSGTEMGYDFNECIPSLISEKAKDEDGFRQVIKCFLTKPWL